MKKIVAYTGMLLGVLIFTSCGHNRVERGLFKATMGEKEYEVDIGCTHLDEDYFKFRSDKTVHADSNGDGLIISGVQMNKRLILTLEDHGQKYSTQNMMQWKKDGIGASGTGVLYNDITATESHKMTFEMTCR